MEEDSVAVTGGCLCGAIRYEAVVDPHGAYYCHCRTCQRSSGTPADTDVPAKSLQFIKGEPRYFQSSPFAERGFCEICGSRLTYRMISGEWTTLTLGCLDNPTSIVPEKHYCVETQVSWYKTAEDLPRIRSDEIPELVTAWAEAGKEGR